MNPVPFPANLEDDELRRWLRYVSDRLGTLEAGAQIIFSATLASDLNSGDSVTLGGKTYVGTAIRSGYKLASGTTIFGAYNGTNYTIIGWNTCEVEQ